MNTTIERLEQIETERMQTMSDPAFQNWMSNLNISRSYEDPEGRFRAMDMMGSYDFGKKIEKNLVVSEINRIFTK
jgi:hypothetical protein